MYIKAISGWVVVKPDGTPLYFTIKGNESDSRFAYVKLGLHPTWPTAEKAGYKCVPVDIEFTPNMSIINKQKS